MHAPTRPGLMLVMMLVMKLAEPHSACCCLWTYIPRMMQAEWMAFLATSQLSVALLLVSAELWRECHLPKLARVRSNVVRVHNLLRRG